MEQKERVIKIKVTLRKTTSINKSRFKCEETTNICLPSSDKFILHLKEGVALLSTMKWVMQKDYKKFDPKLQRTNPNF